ncbi:MAG: ATP-binding protein [bacterium]
MHRPLSKVNKYLFFLFGLTVIFSIGIVYVSKVSKNEEKKIREEMIVLTQTFADILDSQKFKNLQLNLSDKENQDYKDIREKLLEIGRLNKVFGIRWIYTIVPKDGQIVFSVDSIPNDSPDYSDPGDIYTDASLNFKEAVDKAWTSGISSITEPYTDKWGNCISTVVPVVDKENNETVSVLASDMDYKLFYQNKINNTKRLPILIIIFSEISFSVVFFYVLYLLRDKKELLEKNIILKQYVEHVPGIFFQFQIFPDGRKTVPYVSKRIWEIFEVTKEEVKENASKIFDRVYGDDLKEFNDSIKNSMDTMKEWDHEFRVNLSRGIRWLRGKSRPEKLSDGSFLWYGYVTDITEHKEMELEMQKKASQIKQEITEIEKANTKLKENRESILSLMTDMAKTKKSLEVDDARMKTIISSMGEGLIILDRQYKITLINPKALELLGYEENEILGKNLYDVVKFIKSKKEIPVKGWPIEKSFTDNQIITTSLEDDISIKTERQNSPLAVTISVAPLNSELKSDQNKANVVMVIRDANKDRELDRAKSGFISTASHQLRTPLTTIRWYSEMLLSGSYGMLNKSQIDLAKEIHDGVNRLYQTINLLLGISRIESGKTGKEKIPIDLTVITTEVIRELSPSMIEKKLVYFSFSAQTDPIVVLIDPVSLRQVILNLFANAIRYTNNNGTIEGRWLVDKENKEVVYSVRDNGIGIPVVARNRIFSKFFRAENAILKIPDGTGLGLAFVKDIVTSWGGRVWFETEEGKGTTFFFTIPTE